ncbi:MAG: sigma-70 family RNA polymerase sigma factor [Chitinophagaceae bacterium]|nr:sigma-70 family RNA polymerase sigma factor [Chitinophagaceae bacterium]MBK9485226.1 sigma-70 family RNA polymerase sigma factor [Chitinophagaceae bacterium]
MAVLTKLFGPQNLQLAEDVVQDTLLKAFNNWKINGLPQNPSAWLFTVARNKAIDVLRQQKRQNEVSKNLTPLLQSEYSLVPTVQELVNTNTIDDDQLRMMFVCCHPALSTEAQVSLILKTLCGFSVTEIAKAFVTGYDTIEKRLTRARQSFRDNNVQFELPPAAELENRLDNVLLAIYLLFNEGYNSTQHEDLIRKDLMHEAMQLCELICRSRAVDHFKAHALMALICFTASRNEARQDAAGNILLLKEQDRKRWNKALIEKGIFHLEASSEAEQVNKYQLEAGIAYEHARAASYSSTNWRNILKCYDLMCQFYPSPIIELNRAIVISEINGPAEGIKAIEAITNLSALKKYYLLPATLGELNWQLQNNKLANQYFAQAMELTKSAAERKLLQQKMNQH